MQKGSVEAIFYKGDGLPVREFTRRCWKPDKGEVDRREQIRMMGEVGFTTRTVREGDRLTDVTPMQEVITDERVRRRFSIEFGLGVAWLKTDEVYLSKDGQELPLGTTKQPFSEDEPLQITNQWKTTNAQGEREEYTIAELHYHERDDRDDHGHQEAPTPAPTPSEELILTRR